VKVPSLPYQQIIRALQSDGWTVVRQRGSHIRLQKRLGSEVLKIAQDNDTSASSGQTLYIGIHFEASTVGRG